MFVNLLRIAMSYCTRAIHSPKEVQKVSMPTRDVKHSKYEDDINALENVYGNLQSKALKVELQELLKIVPRERRRIDAYSGLVSELAKEKGCELTIVSRKTK